MGTFSKSELLLRLPRKKDDAANAIALIKLGYPVVEPVLPQMLDWLRTNGSPVDLVMRDFFAALGRPAIEVVSKALRSRHELLQHTILAHVVDKWSCEDVSHLKGELEMLVTGSGFYGTDIVAMQLLQRHGLSDTTWLREWAEFKVERLRRLLQSTESCLEDIHRQGLSRS